MNDKMRYPKALLFDMDGVLVDSTESWRGALNDALRRYGQRELSKEEFLDQYWGADLFQILEKLGLDMGIGRFCNAIYPEHIRDVKLFPETIDTLERLRDVDKALVTNTTLDCTERILDKYGIRQYFLEIVTSDQVQYGKPRPDMLILACERLGRTAGEVMMIGDTINDIIAARDARCTSIGIGVDGDYRIGSLKELPSLLKRIMDST
ncbi:MAG TPA: HAD family hydrolase [Candidatus Methanofastidiosa archaeon]|nr:HAD family hydrolase [Candidatus Methanofastidiosa archaeon]